MNGPATRAASIIISGDTSGDPCQVGIKDTNTGINYGLETMYIPTTSVAATFPYFVSITGLAAGAHTFQFYVSKGSGAVVYLVANSYGICQRIF